MAEAAVNSTPANPTNNTSVVQATATTANTNTNNTTATSTTVAGANNAESDKIKFSMGLEALQITDGTLSTSSIGSFTSGINYGTGYSTGNAALGQLTGNWVSDPNLKQVGMIMTVFQSFPVSVQGQSNPYTMVVDKTSTSDGAGTNHGELCIGVLGCPDGYNLDLLKKVASNTNGGGFKVGVSCWNKRGVEYMQHFYGDIMTVGQFNVLRRKCLLNVEVVVPTGGNMRNFF